LVLDISDRQKPRVDQRVGGLGRPWNVEADESAIYVADHEHGLVVMERSTANRPSPVETHSIGGVQAISMNSSVLAAAAGSDGVALFSREDPLALKPLSTVDLGTFVIDVAVDGDVLWAVTHERVHAIDIQDPESATPIASRTTPYWAMAVAAQDDEAWVGDWGAIRGFTVNASLPAADIDVQVSEMLLDSKGETVSLLVHNRGRDTLEIDAVGAQDTTLQVSTLSELDVPSGAELRLELEWRGGEVDTLLCIRSNDPDEPIATVRLHTGGATHPLVGQPAPDFSLIDLEGNEHRLSDQLGHPVVLSYFATW